MPYSDAPNSVEDDASDDSRWSLEIIKVGPTQVVTENVASGSTTEPSSTTPEVIVKAEPKDGEHATDLMAGEESPDSSDEALFCGTCKIGIAPGAAWICACHPAPLCPSCVLKGHRFHNLSQLPDFQREKVASFAKIKRQMQVTLEKLRRECESLQTTVSGLTAQAPSLLLPLETFAASVLNNVCVSEETLEKTVMPKATQSSPVNEKELLKQVQDLRNIKESLTRGQSVSGAVQRQLDGIRAELERLESRKRKEEEEGHRTPSPAAKRPDLPQVVSSEGRNFMPQVVYSRQPAPSLRPSGPMGMVSQAPPYGGYRFPTPTTVFQSQTIRSQAALQQMMANSGVRGPVQFMVAQGPMLNPGFLRLPPASRPN